jgi:hypothetical protein
MARASIWLAKFNREADFVAQRPMLVNGAKLLPGDLIDKTKFSTRRLRCLYEMRKIRVATLNERQLLRWEINEDGSVSGSPVALETFKIDPSTMITIHATPGEIVRVAPKKRGRPKRAVA